MLPYIIVSAVIAFAALIFPQKRPNPIAWLATYVMLLIFVGLRHKVGMDWNNYLLMIQRIEPGSLMDSFTYAEPAYATLVWVSARLDAGIYGANFLGTAIFLFGLFAYARTTPLPWLALVVAMPMLVIVVAMSANRQAVAIGVLLLLASDWRNSSSLRRVLLILFAAMFHFSAAFFMIYVAFDLKLKRSYKIILSFFTVSVMIGFLEYSGSIDRYDKSYISGQNEMTYSSGAILHVLFNGLPAVLLFMPKSFRNRLFPSILHQQMALTALFLIPMALVFSAAAGRMTLYLFPVSMYVFSALPSIFESNFSRGMMRSFLGIFFVFVAWFWLAYANSSVGHIPYFNIIGVGM